MIPFGSIALNFYVDTKINDGETESRWAADALNSGTQIGLRFMSGEVFAMAWYSPDGTTGSDGTFIAFGTWTRGAFSITAGSTTLPSTFTSSLDLFQNSNWGRGGTVIVAPMLAIGFAGFQIGAAAKPLDADPASQDHGLDSYIPLFFAAYDYKAENFTAGATFTGWANKLDSPNSSFPFLATVRGRFGSAPLSIGFNAGLYAGLPSLFSAAYTPVVTGVFGIGQYGPQGMASPEDSLVFEGFFEFKYTVNEKVSAAFSAGYIHELAPEDKGGGNNWLQLGFDVPAALGSGFTITPGVIYVNALSGNTGGKIEDEKQSELQCGVTLKYSF